MSVYGHIWTYMDVYVEPYKKHTLNIYVCIYVRTYMLLCIIYGHICILHICFIYVCSVWVRRRVPGSGRGPGSIHETGSNSGRHGLCSRSSRHRSISTSAVTAAAAVALTITILHHCRRRSHRGIHRSVANTASAVCF